MEEQHIKISVIIPVHNTEKYIKDCLQSVIGQNFMDVEIICIDDGSVDSSGMILNEYKKQYRNIKVIHQKCQGPSVARNNGLKNAKGKYVLFLDSDDMYEEEAFSKLYSIAEQEHTDLVLFDGYSIYETDRLEKEHLVYKKSYSREKTYGKREKAIEFFSEFYKKGEFSVSPCFLLYRREFLEQHKLLFYPGILHEDNLFVFTTFLMAGISYHTAAQYYIRRVRENSIMTQNKTFKHFYGLYITYVEILKYIE